MTMMATCRRRIIVFFDRDVFKSTHAYIRTLMHTAIHAHIPSRAEQNNGPQVLHDKMLAFEGKFYFKSDEKKNNENNKNGETTSS